MQATAFRAKSNSRRAREQSGPSPAMSFARETGRSFPQTRPSRSSLTFLFPKKPLQLLDVFVGQFSVLKEMGQHGLKGAAKDARQKGLACRPYAISFPDQGQE